VLANLLRACLVTVLAGLLVAVLEWGARETLEARPRVVDGDTLVLDGREVRLLGIDAPEYRQSCELAGKARPCGEEAAAALRRLIGAGPVRCTGRRTDKYGRLLARCTAGEDLGAKLVRDGFAVAYGDYEIEEAAAKSARRGIWAGTFERPADFRARMEKASSLPAPHAGGRHAGLVRGRRGRRGRRCRLRAGRAGCRRRPWSSRSVGR
jgi:endonuclease YncB( thermonuclease family)